jgi:hypothetical protein
MDVERLARQVGVRDQDVVVKAREFVRMASVRLAGNSLGQVRGPSKQVPVPTAPQQHRAGQLQDNGAGEHVAVGLCRAPQGEVCKAAACLELACTS